MSLKITAKLLAVMTLCLNSAVPLSVSAFSTESDHSLYMNQHQEAETEIEIPIDEKSNDPSQINEESAENVDSDQSDSDSDPEISLEIPAEKQEDNNALKGESESDQSASDGLEIDISEPAETTDSSESGYNNPISAKVIDAATDSASSQDHNSFFYSNQTLKKPEKFQSKSETIYPTGVIVNGGISDLVTVLTWSRVENAQFYEVYKRHISESNYSRIARLDQNTLTYTDKYKFGTITEKYHSLYKVRAAYTDKKGETVYSNFTEPVCSTGQLNFESYIDENGVNLIVDCSTPFGRSGTSSNKYGCTNILGRIYRSTSLNGEYQFIGEIYSGKPRFPLYTDTTAEKGKTYFYKIKAYIPNVI